MNLARNLVLALMTLMLVASGLGPAVGAEMQKEEKKGGVALGKLTCKTEPGTRTQKFLQSSVSLDCTFKPNDGPEQKYDGEIGFLGVDLGKREERILYFGVFGYSTDIAHDSYPLQGNYYGTTVGAGMFGQGYGSSALVGGMKKSFSIVPSVETFKGEGVIAGGTKMYLEPDKKAQMKGQNKPVKGVTGK